MAVDDMLTALGRTVDDEGLEEALRSAVDETLADGEPRDREPPAPSIPERIGRYTVIRRLGAGTMGVVYEAHDEQVDRRVALKLLRGRGAKTERVRLMREAQALAQLSHPNVVNVFEVGIQDGHAYLVMELVEGTSLDRWLQDEPRTVRKILDVFVQAGQGLAAAHDAGFVHRDFKPGNVLVGADGRVRVLDFGLARAHSGPLSGEHTASPSSTMSVDSLPQVWGHDLTHVGAMLGTPAYMSPEQLGTEPVTSKSDQFSFCVALHEAVYQQHPFIEHGQLQELLHNILFDQRRPSPERSDVPTRVRSALQRGLASEPQARWPSMPELLHELEAAQRPSRWKGRAAVGAVIVAAGLGGAWALLGAPRDDDALACTGADAKLAEVWGPSQRAAVERAFSATTLSYAEQTGERVGPLLDAYAERWSITHTAACESGRDDARALDRRMACLERLRHALGAQVEILANADAAVVEQAVAAVEGLRPAQACLEPSEDDASAPPDDPELAVRYEGLVQELERVDALSRSGRYEAALKIAEHVATEARALPHLWLEARALLAMGEQLRDLGAYDQAEQQLERAYFLAQQIGSDSIALRATERLVLLVGVDEQDYERGLEWTRHAEVEIERGASDVARGEYLSSKGLLLMQMGEYEDALELLREALALVRSAPESNDFRIADHLGRIGIVLRRLDRNEEALEHQRQALEILERILGPNHPEVARTLNNMATAQYSLGRVDDAVVSTRRAVDIWEASPGSDRVPLANALTNSSVMLGNLSRHEEAVQAARRALELLEQADTAPHTLCAALINLASAQVGLGNYEDGIKTHRRAISRLEELGLHDHPDYVLELLNLAEALTKVHDSEQAHIVLERVIARLDPASEADTKHFLAVHELWAQASLERGSFDDAIAHAEQWFALERPSTNPYYRATMELRMAKARWGTGHRAHDQALAHAREATRIADELPPNERVRELREEIQAWRIEHDPAVEAAPTEDAAPQ